MRILLGCPPDKKLGIYPVRESKKRISIFMRVLFSQPALSLARSRRHSLTGFTMIEIVVMLGILVLVSAMILGNFTGFNENGALIRAAQEVGVNLRKAQNTSLAVARVTKQDGTLYPYSPKSVGIHFDKTAGTASQQYTMFFEDPTNISGSGPLGLYQPGIDPIISVTSLLRGVAVKRIYIDAPSPCNNLEYTQADVIFTAPEANVIFSGDGASPINCAYMKIDLVSPTLNLTKTVTVRLTGQISVQ